MLESRPIIVLGAGVIGLTTAIRLLDSPLCTIHHHPIHIIADHMPSDPLDVRYASTLAGAHHLSFADDGDERNRRWDRTTFRVMYDEWEKEGEKTGLMVIKQTEYYVDAGKHLKIYEEHPNFKIEHSTFADHAVSFTSLTMTPRTYLLRLVRLLDGRATIHRHHFSSLTDPFMTALIGPSPPLAVLVCVGLGASTLGGVSDPHIFPTRGQTVKVHAPWLKAGFTRQVGSLRGGEGGERTYIIPRADGDVILGGTREAGDWEAKPREETGRDILRRTLEICPDLCRPSASTFTKEERLKALEGMVVSNLVGFRPSRRGGTRLERGPDLVLKGSVNGNGHGDANGDGDRDQGKTVVVYNYGHGGAGWQSCWGSAEDAVELLVKSVM